MAEKPLLTKALFDDHFKKYDNRTASLSIGQVVKLISNDGNNSVEYVLGFDKKFGEITSYSNSRLSITKNTGSNYGTTFSSIEFSDIVNADEFKLNDQVLMWKVYQNNTYVLEAPGVLKGTLTGSSGSSSSPRAIVDGKNVNIARDHIDPADFIVSDLVNKELEFYLDKDQIAGVNQKNVVRTPDNYLVVTASRAEGVWGGGATYNDPLKFTASVLTSGGTRATYEIDKLYLNGTYGSYNNSEAVLTDSGAHGNPLIQATATPVPGLTTSPVHYAEPVKPSSDPAPTLTSIDGKVFRYNLSASTNKLTLYEPDVLSANIGARSEGAASVSISTSSLSSGRRTTTGLLGAKSLNAQTVGFIKSTEATNRGDSWFVFTGFKNIPATIATAGDGANSFSAVTGKVSVNNDLIKAYAVNDDKYDGIGGDGHYGIMLENPGTPTDGGGVYTYTLFNGTSVVSYKSSVGIGGFHGYDPTNARGTIVRYYLSGSIIDRIEAVNLVPEDPYNLEGTANPGGYGTGEFYAGYVVSSSSTNGLRIAQYQDSTARPTAYTGQLSFVLRNTDSKIFLLKDDDQGKPAEEGSGWEFLTLDSMARNTGDLNDFEGINFNESGEHLYNVVVVQKDASKYDSQAETIFVFEENQQGEVVQSRYDDWYNNKTASAIESELKLTKAVPATLGATFTVNASAPFVSTDTEIPAGIGFTQDLTVANNGGYTLSYTTTTFTAPTPSTSSPNFVAVELTVDPTTGVFTVKVPVRATSGSALLDPLTEQTVTIPVSVHATNGTKSGDITYDVTVKYTRTAADSSYTNAVAITAEKERIEALTLTASAAAGANADASLAPVTASFTLSVASGSTIGSTIANGGLQAADYVEATGVSIDSNTSIRFAIAGTATTGRASNVTVPLTLTYNGSDETFNVSVAVTVS
ncbi:hypothetical protein FACS1894171_2160 [Clostridia bacterium]|nr:hypothetical protein FACS1894171_2160 [Clostridia bacterium]